MNDSLHKPFEITIKQGGVEVTVKKEHSMIGLEDLIDAFLTCAEGVTWSKAGIIDFIKTEY